MKKELNEYQSIIHMMERWFQSLRHYIGLFHSFITHLFILFAR
jgi:hypothetical protein